MKYLDSARIVQSNGICTITVSCNGHTKLAMSSTYAQAMGAMLKLLGES